MPDCRTDKIVEVGPITVDQWNASDVQSAFAWNYRSRRRAAEFPELDGFSVALENSHSRLSAPQGRLEFANVLTPSKQLLAPDRVLYAVYVYIYVCVTLRIDIAHSFWRGVRRHGIDRFSRAVEWIKWLFTCGIERQIIRIPRMRPSTVAESLVVIPIRVVLVNRRKITDPKKFIIVWNFFFYY